MLLEIDKDHLDNRAQCKILKIKKRVWRLGWGQLNSGQTMGKLCSAHI